MFDTYTEAFNNLKINSVSGSLIKTHPKSFFLPASSQSKIFAEYPELNGDYITVLQVLIRSEDRFLCEIVKNKDYLKRVDK